VKKMNVRCLQSASHRVGSPFLHDVDRFATGPKYGSGECARSLQVKGNEMVGVDSVDPVMQDGAQQRGRSQGTGQG
jgi:hypothetical protein